VTRDQQHHQLSVTSSVSDLPHSQSLTSPSTLVKNHIEDEEEQWTLLEKEIKEEDLILES
jgi:hypothetical protein